MRQKINLHGILFLGLCLSLQQRHETQHAITIINMTDTHPTISKSCRLIWQLRPANQGWHSQRTFEGPFVLSPSKTHFPFLLQRSHSVVVAKKIVKKQNQNTILKLFAPTPQRLIGKKNNICKIQIISVSLCLLGTQQVTQ